MRGVVMRVSHAIAYKIYVNRKKYTHTWLSRTIQQMDFFRLNILIKIDYMKQFFIEFSMQRIKISLFFNDLRTI